MQRQFKLEPDPSTLNLEPQTLTLTLTPPNVPLANDVPFCGGQADCSLVTAVQIYNVVQTLWYSIYNALALNDLKVHGGL